MADTRRRVKVYTLNEERQWDDRGTGHVSYSYVDRLKGMALVVRAEQDGTLLLESKILIDTAYQKQQETLIVWSESDGTDNESTDLALSFQEKAGCDEIWEQICEVQGKDPSVNVTQDVVEDGEEDENGDRTSDVGMASAEPIELPPCEIGHIVEIADIFTSCLSYLPRREKLAIAVETEDYITKLLALFRMCEDLEHTDGLHRLHEIFKNLFLLNKSSLFEVMLDEKNIMDVVGCLEYDPGLSEPIKHREYLLNKAKFREVLSIKNEKLRKKIHQTFRVQYIQEVILPTPTVFEENMLSTLNSFIFFNKVEIVNMIQEDEEFLKSLFEQLLDDTKEESRRVELAGFLRELCSYSQTLQIAKRYEFLRTLADLGVLPVVESLLQTDSTTLKQLAIDVFAHVVEHNPSMVREYVQREMEDNRNGINGRNSEDDVLLINLAIEQMICDPDPELSGAMQLMSLVRILLDPENMMASKNEKTEFLSFFYSHSMHVMMTPLLANTTGDKPAKDDYQTAHLLSIILELVTFSVEHHTFQVKNYIINKNLLRRILILLKSKHTFLALAALRFMRKIISMRDEFYHRYIVRESLFQPVVDTLFKSGKRYNLLNSAALEMFEFIISEDITSLINHIETKHMEILSKIKYVTTFNVIHQKYEQYNDGVTYNTDNVARVFNPARRDPRTMDEEEEMWFEEDETEDDLLSKLTDSDTPAIKINIDKILDDKPKDNPSVVETKILPTCENNEPAVDTPEKAVTALVNGNGKIKNENGSGDHASTEIVKVKSGIVGGLVDYSDDESEEDDENGEEKINKSDIGKIKTSAPVNDTEPARKKPRMSEVTKGN